MLRLLLFLRRHLTGVQGVEDLLPKLGFLDIGDLKGDLLEVHLSLLGRGIMTIEAIVLDEIKVLFSKAHFSFFGSHQSAKPQDLSEN